MLDFMKFHVVLEKQEEGGFIVYVPELPGCHTQGETKEETLKNIKEARDLYLETLKDKHGHVAQRIEIGVRWALDIDSRLDERDADILKNREDVMV